MNLSTQCIVLNLTLVFASTLANAESTVFPVVGLYDGAGEGNTVDKSAEFYAGNSSGVGDNASLIMNIDTFRSEIKSAFSNGRGGVVGFDNATIEGGTQADSFIASFGEKSLVVQSVDNIRTDYTDTNICVSISSPEGVPGTGFLSKSNVNGDQIKIRSSFDFTFTEKDFGAGEHVTAVGGTILGRNGSSPASKWLMKVKLDNGDVVAEIADVNFRSGNSRDDTFFGIRAPAGRYITGVAWINLNGTYSGLDGFAFFTNGAREVAESSKSDRVEYPTGDDNSDTNTVNYTSLFGSSRPSR